MENCEVKTIVCKLQRFIRVGGFLHYNYERNLLVDKAPYLDAFIENRIFPPFEVEIQISSKCNLQCRWCIGDKIQEKNYVQRLPNLINKDNIDKIIDGIIDFQINDLSIERVKFSGFNGEPLVPEIKATTLRAIQRLAGAGRRVGLFTNGVFMDKDTWETLANIEYVHISLDAGRSSYFWLKESPKGTYTEETFNKVINNIKGLDKTRKKKSKSNLEISVGYVVIPGNHNQIYETAKLVKESGADRIRFKCDIGGRFSLVESGVLETVFQEIEQAKQDLEGPSFTVHTIHSKEDIKATTYKDWRCKRGCFYHNFHATIGSDGNVYLCDHNTMVSAIPFGNAINQSFEEIWKGKCRKYLINGIRYICRSDVCPPFGNRANFFLNEIYKLTKKFGISSMKKAINELRTKYTN